MGLVFNESEREREKVERGIEEEGGRGKWRRKGGRGRKEEGNRAEKEGEREKEGSREQVKEKVEEGTRQEIWFWPLLRS